MGSIFERTTGVVKYRRTEQVLNNINQVCQSFGHWIPPRSRKARQIRIWCFGKRIFFLLFPLSSIAFRQVQEGGELVSYKRLGIPSVQISLCWDRTHGRCSFNFRFCQFQLPGARKICISFGNPEVEMYQPQPEHVWYKWLSGSSNSKTPGITLHKIVLKVSCKTSVVSNLARFKVLGALPAEKIPISRILNGSRLRGDRARRYVSDPFRGYVLLGPPWRNLRDRNDSPLSLK